MSKIAFAGAVLALTAAVPLTMGCGCAEAQPLAPYLAPGTAPPWGITTTTTTTTEAKPVPTPAATAATQPSIDPTPIQGTAMPIQGATTPIHAVFLHAGPNGEAAVIGTLHPGEPLRILASAPGGWMQVETPAGFGWAYGSYLAPAGSTVVVQHPALTQESIGR